jgi:hypothetical protein
MTDPKVHTSDNCVIAPCSCQHEYQDKRYGKGIRVHNRKGGGATGVKGHRCTVCGKSSDK